MDVTIWPSGANLSLSFSTILGWSGFVALDIFANKVYAQPDGPKV